MVATWLSSGTSLFPLLSSLFSLFPLPQSMLCILSALFFLNFVPNFFFYLNLFIDNINIRSKRENTFLF
jgi:pilus assembly protein TadC